MKFLLNFLKSAFVFRNENQCDFYTYLNQNTYYTKHHDNDIAAFEEVSFFDPFAFNNIFSDEHRSDEESTVIHVLHFALINNSHGRGFGADCVKSFAKHISETFPNVKEICFYPHRLSPTAPTEVNIIISKARYKLFRRLGATIDRTEPIDGGGFRFRARLRIDQLL